MCIRCFTFYRTLCEDLRKCNRGFVVDFHWRAESLAEWHLGGWEKIVKPTALGFFDASMV